MFEQLQQTITIGSFSIPLIIVLLIISWIIYSVAVRALYRGRETELKPVDNFIFTAAVIVLLGWKLSPVIFQFSTVIKNPAAVLYLPGGSAGFLIGAAAAAVYIVLSLLRIKEGRTSVIKNLLMNTAILVGAVVIIFSAGIAIQTRNAESDKSTGAVAGAYAPGFSEKDITGQTYSLSDYRGRYVVINFWASWCPPCRAELPELVRFYNDSGGGDIVFLSVNLFETERNPDGLKEFIQDENLPYPVIIDRDGRISDNYGVQTIPVTVVIDPDGRISSIKNGAVTASWLHAAVR